ncbi:MAG: hypothetical protein K6E75_09355 [Lachnospiraceae bacterium]|nr:hypothetical protein [Lachnospiraceae bacterium]
MKNPVVNVIVKTIYAILVFVLAVFISDRVMNRESADMTAEMEDASFPLVFVVRDGHRINCMRGMILQMDEAYVCDSVTPVDSVGRQLDFEMDTYGCNISGISYEVRDTYGERLIENGRIDDLEKTDAMLRFSLALKDLLETEKEYVLRLAVENGSKGSIYFDSRIRICENIEKADEAIEFALDFSDKTFDREQAKTLTTYLESNEQGDNTTYARVDIHSSFSQITWGDLQVERKSDPKIKIERINPYVATVTLTYPLSLSGGQGQEEYNIREYYYLRFGQERLYLLDYLRTMNSFFSPRDSVYANNKISLGITDPDTLQVYESEGGSMLAFVKENVLYFMDASAGRVAVVFSFYDEEHTDDRVTYDGAQIRILSVDEIGNIRFLVNGYMNRGLHEGGVGLACYYYNSTLNTVEEEVYIPSYTSAEYLKKEAGESAFVGNGNKLYVIAGGKLHRIDLLDKSYQTIEENLIYGNYVVSSDRHLIAWTNPVVNTLSSAGAGRDAFGGSEDDTGTDGTVYLLNLVTGRKQTLTDAEGGKLKPLGFVGNDLVIGLAESSEMRTDQFGNPYLPMRAVQIMDEEGTVLETYEKPGVRVTGVSITDERIQLSRVQDPGDGVLHEIEDDYIMNDAALVERKNPIEVVATQNLEKITQIAVGSSLSSGKMKVQTPRQVLFEGNRQVFLTKRETETPYYFVYDREGLCGLFVSVGSAIRRAEEANGSVIDQKGRRIWEKSGRGHSYQISGIAEAGVEEDKGSVAVCLEAILKKEGISIDAGRLIRSGETIRSILEKQMPDGQVMDLKGCSLDSVLYYVGKDIPVMALLKDGSAVLLVGYNEQNTILLNPASGKIMKMGINDSTDYFAANGNQFIAYMVGE